MTTNVLRAERWDARLRLGDPLVLAVMLVSTTVLFSLGFWLKLSAVTHDQVWSYSDVGDFWKSRDVGSHVFPYIHGSLDHNGQPVGGAYEYPVLTGIIIWLASLPADDAESFLRVNGAVAGILTLAVTTVLWFEGGQRAWWWAASPALLFYPLYNWDLPAVLCAVVGVAIFKWPGWSLRSRALLATGLLGVGFAAKIYPGFLVVPICLYLLLGDGRPPWAPRVRLAVEAAVTAVGVVLLINLPFVLFGREGWWSSIVFQGRRHADYTTNSLWYWGVRPAYERDISSYDALVDRWSPTLIVFTFSLVLWAGWRLWRSGHHPSYPWLQASAAMLAAFFIFHKVNSPQYALWLIPFFVVLRVHPLGCFGYIAANVCLGVGYFRHLYGMSGGRGLLTIGVWAQVVVLVVLAVLFLLAEPARPSRHSPSTMSSTQLQASHVRQTSWSTDQQPRLASSQLSEAVEPPTNCSTQLRAPPLP